MYTFNQLKIILILLTWQFFSITINKYPILVYVCMNEHVNIIWLIVFFFFFEDSLKQGIATHSSIRALRIPWTEKPGRLQALGLQRVGHNWVANTFLVFSIIYKYRNFYKLSLELSLCICLCFIKV